ncbi:MAG: DUF4159 domain-containing protein [Gemmatimonadota bacterium]|jgi:hypothetical protein|nr:DUF4159 domain-containing protein [Gemmatimonadota bacterium]
MKTFSIGILLLAPLIAAGAVSRNGAAAGTAGETHATAFRTASSAADQFPRQSRGGFYGAEGDEDETYSFYFSRAAYGSGGRFGRSAWATDYPDADVWITNVLRRLTGVDVAPYDHVVRLDDPKLRRFPFLYAVEVGSMGLAPAEVQGLREYLLAGGFLMVDDFWGAGQWENFEWEIGQVLPEYPIVEIPLDHEIFSSYYAIREVIQVPNVNNGIAVGMGAPGARTEECPGCSPHIFGILDDKDRLLVIINWNSDLGDAWEHAENQRYPLMYSTYAYQVAANFIIYAMTH